MVQDAVESGADIIMLDNMDNDLLNNPSIILPAELKSKFPEMLQKKTLKELRTLV